MVDQVPVDKSAGQSELQDAVLGKIDDLEQTLQNHLGSGFVLDMAMKALEIVRHAVQRHPPS